MSSLRCNITINLYVLDVIVWYVCFQVLIICHSMMHIHMLNFVCFDDHKMWSLGAILPYLCESAVKPQPTNQPLVYYLQIIVIETLHRWWIFHHCRMYLVVCGLGAMSRHNNLFFSSSSGWAEMMCSRWWHYRWHWRRDGSDTAMSRGWPDFVWRSHSYGPSTYWCTTLWFLVLTDVATVQSATMFLLQFLVITFVLQYSHDF